MGYMHGMMHSANVDELAAQYDILDSNARLMCNQNMNMMEMLKLTNQKDSTNKIYPGFYDPHFMHSKHRMREFFPPGHHTCFTSSGQQ
jgi:hypothetical protein